jgi:hypothetical protein
MRTEGVYVELVVYIFGLIRHQHGHTEDNHESGRIVAPPVEI